MGRNSKLSDKDREAITRRNLDGESMRSIAKDFGVSEATIRTAVSSQNAEIKKVANQIVATNASLNALPISAQIYAHNHAQKLMYIASELMDAASSGANTANRLSKLANNRIDNLNEIDALTEDGKAEITAISALTRVSNEASLIGTNLIRAAKEIPKEPDNPDNARPRKMEFVIVE